PAEDAQLAEGSGPGRPARQGGAGQAPGGRAEGVRPAVGRRGGDVTEAREADEIAAASRLVVRSRAFAVGGGPRPGSRAALRAYPGPTGFEVAFHHPGSPASAEQEAARPLGALSWFSQILQESFRENGPWPDPGSTAPVGQQRHRLGIFLVRT